MSPRVKVKELNEWTGFIETRSRPLYEHYNQFSKNVLEQKGDKFDKIRVELFGHKVYESTTLLYNEMSILEKLGISLAEWDTYDIHYKAQTMAYVTLNSMIETLRRFKEIGERNKKSHEDSLKNKGRRR